MGEPASLSLLQESTLSYSLRSSHATTMPRDSVIAGDRIPPSKQPNKRRLQAEMPESLKPSSSTTRTRLGRFVTGGRQEELSVPQRQSDEHLRDHSRKKARTGQQQPRAKSAGSKQKGETRPQTARSQSVKSKPSSSRPSSHRPTDDRRSATLSAEPPPISRSITRPSIEQDPSRDPDFELKRCAREQFRETGGIGRAHV